MAHILGLLAFLCTASGYALKSDTHLRWVSLCGLSLFLLHTLLLDAYATSLVMGLAFLMLSAQYTGRHQWGKTLWLINIILLPSSGILVLAGHMDWTALVPLSASVLINTALMYAAQNKLTLMLTIGELLAAWNGYLIESPYAAGANLMALSALAWRFWKIQRTKAINPSSLETPPTNITS